MKDPDAVRAFYDEFSARLIGDYLIPNRRILAQLAFLMESIPSTAQRVLVVGCGNGESTRFIAKRIARRAHVLGIDISVENITIARALFPHPRAAYQCRDVMAGSLPGEWDVIVLPDVYEHIPIDDRDRLAEQLAGAMSDRGRLLLTVPTPEYQAMLREAGDGLQIIDEDVTLGDIEELARRIGASVTYLARIAVWHAYDYMHVALERGRDRVEAITSDVRLPIHCCRGPWSEAILLAVGRSGLLYWPWRKFRVLRRLAPARLARLRSEVAAGAASSGHDSRAP